MKDIQAVALCSGGGKGAFQVGVMKALSERGILQKIKTFSGTSVGALNAFMYAIGDVELNEFVWNNLVSPSTMLKTIEVKNRICVSRDSLLKIIDYVGIDRFRRAEADVYAYAYNCKLKKSVPFLLNDKTDDQIRDILLASSAIPMVYGPITIDGVKYLDGGIVAEGDCALGVLRDLGLKNVLLVALDHVFNPSAVFSSSRPEVINLYKKYPELELEVLKPSKGNGGPVGIVDFSQARNMKRIQQGYLDACEFLNSKGFAGDEDVVPAEEPANKAANSQNKAKKCACSTSCCRTRAGTVKAIRKLAREQIKSASDFEEFVALSHFKNINAKTSTLGGHVFYRNIFECDGWRIQKHAIFPLKMHVRILDDSDVRRAWTMNPNELLKNLLYFKRIRRART